MKTEFIDVSETRKTLTIEIPSDVVDAEIDRVAQGYQEGTRPRVPARQGARDVVKQRFRDQILHDVVHGLIPRAVDEALQERGVEPVDTPDITRRRARGGPAADVHRAFETVPPFDPGDLPR